MHSHDQNNNNINGRQANAAPKNDKFGSNQSDMETFKAKKGIKNEVHNQAKATDRTSAIMATNLTSAI